MAYTDGSHASGDDTEDSTDSDGSTLDDGGADLKTNFGDTSIELSTNGLWAAIAPAPVRAFAKKPVAFLLGIVLAQFIGGVETIVTQFIRALLAIADAFVFVATSTQSTLTTAGGMAGSIVLGAISGLLSTLTAATATAGPAAPLLAGGALAAVIIGGAYALRFLWTLAVDAINPL